MTELDKIGIPVLDNEAVAIERNGDKLFVVGIGSRWADNDNAEKAFADVPDDPELTVFTLVGESLNQGEN